MSKGECWAANMPEKHLSFVQRKAEAVEAAHTVAEGIRENVKKQIHAMRLVRKADRLAHKKHLSLAQDDDDKDKAKPEEDDEPKKKNRDLTKEKDFGSKKKLKVKPSKEKKNPDPVKKPIRKFDTPTAEEWNNKDDMKNPDADEVKDEAELTAKDKRTKHEAEEVEDPQAKDEEKSIKKDEKLNDKANPKAKPHCKQKDLSVEDEDDKG